MGSPVPNERARARATVPRKLLITLAVAGVTFPITQLFNPGRADPGLVWSVAGSVFVGGVTFIVQFLIDVERRLEATESGQQRQGRAIERIVNDRFMKVNQATELFGHVEASRLRTGDVVDLVRHSTHIDDRTPDLLANFVKQEVMRLSNLLRRLGEGQDVLYEGEDRDWLLSLTRSAASTIEAVSLSTMDANGQKLIDNDLWKSDLGWRYLDIQKDAVRRKVRIRRIFIFDRPEVLEDLNFLEVYRKHQSFGIEVRVLGLANPM
ncbi:MAG TPA: phosphatidylserine/phosphatidylglycerophosphate/cardiolipin synthase family protein, partial [Micromonosporaceae bacterium]|nr:phosphatidylserine/phosphatidylglycerophosphate/cardiolipin synthase family protein [Micromonosporaceae bacterium]